MSMHARVHDEILRMMARGGPSADTMSEVFDFLAHYRCILLSNTLYQREGNRVMGGPFAGMALVDPFNGNYAPLLLGCYEEELHDIVRGLPAAGYECVLNIGCSDGYYAVGIKRLAPGIEMRAHDIDPKAQQKCRQTAALNNVEIQVAGAFEPEHFALYAGRRTLVWCDIEGAEALLLDPVRFPALADMDILVELHPTEQGHTVDFLPQRFTQTHAIDIHYPRGHVPQMPVWLRDGSQINQLMAQFEWRGVATPWAMMRSRTLPARAPEP